jgi:hypothetical protein
LYISTLTRRFFKSRVDKAQVSRQGEVSSSQPHLQAWKTIRGTMAGMTKANTSTWRRQRWQRHPASRISLQGMLKNGPNFRTLIEGPPAEEVVGSSYCVLSSGVVLCL